MERNNVSCQVCLTNFNGISTFKQHVRASIHQKKMQEVFQKDKFQGHGFFPSITLMDPVTKRDLKQPIIGLSLLTLCFSQETKTFFYLCHVCEEKCPPDKIVSHISSDDHCCNYFNYTDPNVLRFSWVHSMNMSAVWRFALTQEANKKGAGHLQMLTLPGNLIKLLENSTYSEVMRTFSENDKLLKLIEADKPKRMMIQAYQRHSNRKHPLLGMQHLVECICVGQTEKRYYLCTLCNLTLATHTIIKHVLSFDHIYCYFKAWHPSTLSSKESYTDYHRFAPTILDFAKQTEKIHGTSKADMKQIRLEPAIFTSVKFNSYALALKDMESITKESLIISIKQEIKLDHRTVSAGPVAFMYKLYCQDCQMVFETIQSYAKHVSLPSHKQKMTKYFGVEGCNGYDRQVLGSIPRLRLYTYLRESWKQNEPVIGVPLVVTCICTQNKVEPIHVCFACEECFREPVQHFKSQKHLINTLMYQNPWRLPFAWEDYLDVKVLKSQAWEEEKERGPNQMLLKVLDIPYWMFWRLTSNYKKVMSILELQHLKCDVPRRETYSKLEQNERFPLLGQQFLVMHDADDKQKLYTEIKFLCLLCERRLSDEECHGHVFSRDHVAAFLDRFHPGSLSSDTDAETLLDLAKQAGRIHSIAHVQQIQLDKPILEPCEYSIAIIILHSAKRRAGKGQLEPQIMPKNKLVPRGTLKEVDKASQTNSRMMEGSERKTGQNSTDSTEATIKVEAGAEITNTQCVESGGNAEKGDEKVTPTPSGNESERRKVFSKTSPEMKNADSGTCPMVKEENIEEPIVGKPSVETLVSYQHTVKTEKTEIGEESSNGVLTQFKNYTYKENERKRGSSVLENACPNGGVQEEIAHKRQRLTSKDSSSEKTQNLPSNKQKEVITTTTPNHQTETDEASSNVNYQQQAVQLWQYVKRNVREPVIGLDALFECNCDQRDPIYLCECCSLKINEKDVVSHITGAKHQKMYLSSLQKLPSSPMGYTWEENIRDLAARFEQRNGYGEAQVLELDEEVYNNISQESFTSAKRAVTALKALEDSLTSAPSAVKPVDTSKTFHAQDQVLEMEIDDNTEEEAAMSAMTETSSKTYEVLPDSKEDVKKTQIKVSESADKANTHLPVSRSSKEASSLHVSASGTNTTHLLPDSTGNESKAEIISNTTVPPIKIEATSKIVGASQYTATSYSAVPTCTKSITVISKCPGKASSSTSDASAKSTAPISSLRATASSCITTTPTISELRETACKSVATTSRATATNSKGTAANPNSSTSFKIENSSKNSETASKKTKALMKNSVESNGIPNVTKSKAPAAPHLTTLMSEGKNPPTEPSNTSASKTKPSEGPPKVGVDQLIKVSCKGRLQVYCQLCSIRMTQGSNHLFSDRHQSNYVEMKFPGWNANQTEKKTNLAKIVASLAEVEKNIGFQHSQQIEVEIGVYEELKTFPQDKALERLKAMMRPKDSQVSSFTTDNAEVLRLQAASASPCEVSSPDDGMYMPQNEMSGLPTDNQSVQENKHELQTLLVWIPKIESEEEEGNLPVGQSDRTPSLKSSEPDANDLISDQLHSWPTLIKKGPEPVANPSSEDADIAVNIKQETFECDVMSQATVGYTPANKSPVKRKSPESCTDPVATDSGKFAQTPGTCQENDEKRQQQQRSDTQKVSGPSQKAELVPNHLRCPPGPASQALPKTSIGERTQATSHFSIYLKVKGLSSKSIVGMAFVWECQGISLHTFFLCESCRERLSYNDICEHMVSEEHTFKYMLWKYREHLHYWQEEDLTQQYKLSIFKKVAFMISEQEHDMDAQVVMLKPDLHEYVSTAPFSEALKMVQKIKKDPKLSCLPVSTLQQMDQQPEDRQRREESLPSEKQSAQTLETDQRSENEERQKTEKHHSEETAVVADLDGVKQRRVLSPLDVISVSSKADSVVSPFPGTCHSPHETCRSLSMQPELRPLEMPLPKLQVKQEEVHSESPSSPIVSPETSQAQSVSPRDECLPTRKRPAVTSLETLVRSGTSNPQPEDPLPAKHTRSSPQPISHPRTESAFESTPVSSAEASTLRSPKDADAQRGSDKESIVGFEQLVALVRERKSEINMSSCMSDPYNAETTTSNADNSSGSGVERGWDSMYGQPRSKMEENQTIWTSKSHMVKAKVPKNPPATDSFEGMFSGAAPVVSGNLLSSATEAKAASTVLPSASTADPNDPQHQRSVGAQSKFGNVSQLKPSPFHPVPINHIPAKIPQPQGHTKTDSTGVCHLPISPIITARPDPPKQKFMGSYNGPGYTEVTRAHPVAHSFPTDATASPGVSLVAASGGYGQYSQMVYVTNSLAGYISSEAVTGYVKQENPPEGYATGWFYPSQIYPKQEANLFGHLASPMATGWVRQEMQQLTQQQLMQQQQQELMQQQLIQQQQQQLMQQQLTQQQLTQQQQQKLMQQQLTQQQQQQQQELMQQQLTQQQQQELMQQQLMQQQQQQQMQQLTQQLTQQQQQELMQQQLTFSSNLSGW